MRQSGWRFVAVLAAASAFVFSAQPAQAASATISGLVISSSGSPVAGATVALSSGAGTPLQTTTDKTGSFAFTGLVAGIYSLSTAAQNFQRTVSPPIVIADGEQLTDLAIVLQPISGANISTLGHVVIQGRSLNTSSAPTTVITSNDFATQGLPRIDAALDQLPGVTIERYDGGAPGNVTTVTIRGAGAFGSNFDGAGNTGYEVLVLQDGEPIRNGQFGDADVSGFSPDIYQRVEVVEGVGGTSLFGANTIGGTVNFVTRDPLIKEGGQLLFGYGGFGTSDFNLWESNTLGRFGYLLDYHNYYIAGYIPPQFIADYTGGLNNSNPFPSPPTPFQLFGDPWHPTETVSLKSYLGKLRYDLSNSTYLTATFSSEYDWRDQLGNIENPSPFTAFDPSFTPYPGFNGLTNDPLGFPYFFGFPGDYVYNQQPKYSVDLHTTLAGGSLALRTYNNYIQRVVNGLGEPPDICCFESRSVDRLAGEEASWSKDFGKNSLTLAVGGNGDNFFSGSGFSAGTTFQNLSYTSGTQVERTYLARDVFTASPKYELTMTGYLSDYDTLHVRRFDPRFAVVNKPNDSTVLRVSAATGFAAPRLFDIVSPPNLGFGFGATIFTCPVSEPFCEASAGNPNLGIESAFGLDAGVQHVFPDRASVSLDLYRTNLKNHIFTTEVPAPAGLTFSDSSPVLFLQIPANISAAVYQGLEFTGSLPITNAFSFGAKYDIQAAYPTGLSTATEAAIPDLVNNQQFLGVPIHKYGLSLNYHNHARTTAFVETQYYGTNNASNLPPFTLVNVGVNVPLGGNMLHVTDRNVFNKNAGLYTVFGGGVPYPGFSGPLAVSAFQQPPHLLMVTFEHRWGAVR